ncbi:NAD(P)H-quinone oxidoreductase [Thalassotalea fonticola]|uniref:NAD(P)H-quinone oxidoreductase n=1 Tax=Thalassotalea fonticola TaxID=3065649 RepID=A0ABZ0GQR3_9GAMM|nr:NAD(P)H-quinone oxidoreductase [Colwelliaceae bacterium S1-1]
MKFIDVNEQQELVFSQTPPPVIDIDECLLKVHAIGVNRADLLQRAGKYPPPPGESPILGLEVCGEITELGSDVNNFNIGDKVLGLVGGGGYSEYVKIKASHMISLPAHLNYSQGAAIAEVYLTAFQSLFTIADLQPNENVLIHAGASGVGTAAIQLCKAIGAQVTVTVSSEKKAIACQNLGADNIINYKEEDFVAWKKQHLKTGFDVILDVVGGDYLSKNIDVAGLDSRVVMLAMLGGRFCEKVDVAKLLLKRVNIHASTLRSRSDGYKSKLVTDFCEKFSNSLTQGVINPVIEHVFDWSKADQAHSLMSQNKNIGKYILSIND